MDVLIAEDEEDIAFTYKQALKEKKHAVTITNNGEDCLRIYKKRLRTTMKEKRDREGISLASEQQSHPFDVVILDYKMPKKDGLQVAKEIFSVRPKQRVIFASAFVKNTLEVSLRELKQIVEVLQKPFDVDALIDTIEDKQISEGLDMLMSSLTKFKKDNKKVRQIDPTPDQIRDLFEGLRKIQKGRTF